MACFLYFWTPIVLLLLWCIHNSSAKDVFSLAERISWLSILLVFYTFLVLTSSPPSFHIFSTLLINNAFFMHSSPSPMRFACTMNALVIFILGRLFPICLHLQLELSFMAFSRKKELPNPYPYIMDVRHPGGGALYKILDRDAHLDRFLIYPKKNDRPKISNPKK